MRATRYFLITSLAIAGGLVAGCSSAGTSAKRSTSTTASTSTASNWTVAQGGDQTLPGWLDGVDCVTATSCVAVGNESSATGSSNALVDTLSQGSWSAATAPGAPGSQGDYLFSVSCPSAGSCVAVGYYFSMTSSGGTGTILVETLANGKWSPTSTSSLGSGVTDSFSTECPAQHRRPASPLEIPTPVMPPPTCH
jgi:hypothetical protein